MTLRNYQWLDEKEIQGALKAAVEAARRASIKAHLGYFDGIVSAEVVKEIDAKEAMAKAALAAYIR